MENLKLTLKNNYEEIEELEKKKKNINERIKFLKNEINQCLSEFINKGE